MSTLCKLYENFLRISPNRLTFSAFHTIIVGVKKKKTAVPFDKGIKDSKVVTYMANRRNNRGSGDIYGDMYNDQLEKYQRMSGESGGSSPDDLRFYTEDEMDAIDRARQDAARQAYNDAYRAEYERFRKQQTSRQSRYPQYRQQPQAQPRQQRPQQPQRPDFRVDSGHGGGYEYNAQGGGYDGYNSGYDNGYNSGYNGGSQQPQQNNHHSKGSYDDSRRRVHSSPGRYAEAADQKFGDVKFGDKDTEGQKFKKKKPFTFGSFLRIMFVLLLVIVLLFQVLIFRYISMVDSVSTGKRLVTAAELYDSKVTKILLIGSDSRKDDEAGRSDSMIIMSVNSRSKEITLTSVMRDSYVEIPDHGWGKLNSAYTFGGAELLLDTIQLNFGVKIDRYVFVSFFSFINIVDAVGGIELDISDEEAQGMTDPMAEQNKYLKNKKGTDYLKKGGQNMHVNGNQALAYARLRYVGNADFERTDRQRLVINKIVEKAKTLNPLQLDNFLKLSCRELTTNMSAGEMYVFFYKLLFSLTYDRGELRIPPEGAYTYGSHDGLSTLDIDFDGCKRTLRETVYK